MKKPAWIFNGRNILDHQELKTIGFEVNAIGKSLQRKPESGATIQGCKKLLFLIIFCDGGS